MPSSGDSLGGERPTGRRSDPDDDEPTGTWYVWRRDENGKTVIIEQGLSEEVARDMVADYLAEGVEVWAEDHRRILEARRQLLADPADDNGDEGQAGTPAVR